MSTPHLSVLIPTYGRPDSVAETLHALAGTDRVGLDVEVVVIDNEGNARLREICDRADGQGGLPVRYLVETRAGKGLAMDKALDTGGLGELIAVLDDDLTVNPAWCKEAVAVAARHPEHMIFSGCSYVVWPDVPRPDWTHRPSFLGWGFSVLDVDTTTDRELQKFTWPVANHFWIRRSVFDDGRRFGPGWNTEGPLCLDVITETGRPAMVTPHARAGHRVQPFLLDEEEMLHRAIITGRNMACGRLRQRGALDSARLLEKHPIASRLLWTLNAWKWAVKERLARFERDPGRRLERRCAARIHGAKNRERVRIAGQVLRLWAWQDAVAAGRADGRTPVDVPRTL